MPAVKQRRDISLNPAEVMRDELLSAIDPYLDKSLGVPDIIEFAQSDKFCDRPMLYPVQGTILKTAFLQTEIMTKYDYEVLEYFSEMFAATGEYGCQPDILERIKICKAQGRKWFRQWVNIIGRRGSKGFLGGMGGAYVLWNYHALGDPQAYYGIPADKRMAIMVFAGKKEQAKALQWRDLVNIVTAAPCFAPYLPERPLSESLIVYAPHDFVRIADREHSGQRVRHEDMASFEIIPKESTPIGARGPAMIAMLFDEEAHVTKSAGLAADASSVFQSATPALDQFKHDAWIYEGSSPWQMIGQFYDNWIQALLVNVDGNIQRPEMLMFQLESWSAYANYREAHKIPVYPNTHPKHFVLDHFGKSLPLCYPRQKSAIQEYDDEMRKIEAADPEMFAVERRSHWASVLDAYLNPDKIKEMFEPFVYMRQGRTVIANPYKMEAGANLETYIAHGDPGAVNDNFAIIVAHVLEIPGDNLPHVILDYAVHFEPSAFTHNDHQVQYQTVLAEIKQIIRRFMPEQFSFDQGHSVWMQQELREWVSAQHLIKPVRIVQRTATAKSNWNQAEAFKMALNTGHVHCYTTTPDGATCPSATLLRSELSFLRRSLTNKIAAPTIGPITTDDLAICAFNIVEAAIGDKIASMIGASMPELSGAIQGEYPSAQLTPNPNKQTSNPSPLESLRRANSFQPVSPHAPAARGRGLPGNSFGRGVPSRPGPNRTKPNPFGGRTLPGGR